MRCRIAHSRCSSNGSWLPQSLGDGSEGTGSWVRVRGWSAHPDTPTVPAPHSQVKKALSFDGRRTRGWGTALPRVCSGRHRGQHRQRPARARLGGENKPPAQRRSRRPPRADPASRPLRLSLSQKRERKPAPCLVNISRYSSLQWEEDSRTNSGLSLNPTLQRAPSLKDGSICALNVCVPPPAGGHCHCTHGDSHRGWARLFTQAQPPWEQPSRDGGWLLGPPGPPWGLYMGS